MTQDKIYHLIAGVVIGAVFTLLFGVAVGFIAGLVIALAKEGYDKYKYDGADYADMFATFLSSTLTAIAIGALKITPVYHVSVSKYVALGVVAVSGVAMWYLFSKKD